jgi:hypothetical protein
MRVVHSAHPRITFLRKGLRDRLLCGSCEGLIGRYESYFADVWYGPLGLPGEMPVGVDGIIKSGLDYVSFKLFHLSVLWRAGASSLEEFSGVELGPHAERLRQMIFNQSPGEPLEYRLSASVLLRPGSREVHGGVVGVPVRARRDGGWMYSSIYCGCIWHCFVSRSMPVEINVLQEDGTLHLTAIDLQRLPFVTAGLSRAARARRGSRRT